MKNLSFHEKSAWAMIVVLGLASFLYFRPVLEALIAEGVILPPGRLAIMFVIVVVILAIVTQIIAALSNPADASEKLDERDIAAKNFAGHWSGIALGVGVVGSLMAYLILRSGDLMFHTVFAALVVSSLVEYILTIFAYRRGV